MEYIYRTIICDQSSERIGLSVLEGENLLEHGVLTPNKTGQKSFARLYDLFKELDQVVEEYKPDEMVIEHIFYGDFGKTESKSGKKRILTPETVEPLATSAGICQMVAAKHGIKVYRVRPARWKSGCGVKGKTREIQKENAKRIAANHWRIDINSITYYDESDSLCMAAYWVAMAKAYRSGEL